MRCRFAFSQTSDGRLLVTMEALWGFPPGQNGKFCVSAIDDENTFIHHVVLANLAKEETIELIASVLLVVSGRQTSDRWISASLTELQLAAIGMRLDPEESPAPEEPRHPMGFVNEEDLARLFMAAPTPVCMLAGEEHVFTFINPPYLQILGRTKADSVLGRPCRQALSDLEGQPFFAWLDKVYKTGEPVVGIEVPAQLYHEHLGVTRETYFDFVFHPVRDAHGEVCGILCQASDVTERVLERHVRESREEQLYKQWAELDAIYRDSPAGMCLVDAKTLRILRLNKFKARMLGHRIEDLVGKKITELAVGMPYLDEMYKAVIASKNSRSFEVETELPKDPGKRRSFLWNLNPVFSAIGEVESIASVVMEITEWPRSLSDQEESANAV